MPEKFINPYHFVPLTQKQATNSRNDVIQTLVQKPNDDGSLDASVPELLHDRYVTEPTDNGKQQKTFSGRIECQLETLSPCVFGNTHRKVKFGKGKDDLTTIVENLSIDGKAAIAGTSLKGVLSTLAEMASGSAMRVVKKRAMSLRSAMRDARSAVGMVLEFPVKGAPHETHRVLLPLTLPTFSTDRNDKDPDVYKPTYRRHQDENEIWHEIRNRLLSFDSTLGMSALYLKGRGRSSFCSSHTKVVTIKGGTLPKIAWDNRNKRPRATQPSPFTKGSVLRPGKTNQGEGFQDEAFLPTGRGTPGIVRALGKPTVTAGKLYHDLFIPVSRTWLNEECFDFSTIGPNAAYLLPAEDACRKFDTIVQDEFSTAPESPSATPLNKQKRPYRRRGKKGNAGHGLKQGDLVFFTPSRGRNSGEITVKSVSVSSIWREGPRWLWDDDDHSLLNNNPDQVPMNPRRNEVTMAEKLFGWVMDGVKDKDEQDDNELPNGYRGRVRMSDAVSKTSLDDCLLAVAPSDKKRQQVLDDVSHVTKLGDDTAHPLADYFPLQILGSPKLPCPEFYFTGGSQNIRTELIERLRDTIRIQGWKFYVVNPKTLNNNDSANWRTRYVDDNLKQKAWVRPVECGTKFRFFVDFDNLTEKELQLLCYCLRPSENFHHRVGFGKPLGLGVVKLNDAKLSLVDRVQRWNSATNLLSGDAQSRTTNSVADLASVWAKAIGQQHELIKLSGEPVPPGTKVTYPLTLGQETEAELFKWFTGNRAAKDHQISRVMQRLAELSEDMTELPKLKRETLPIGVAVHRNLMRHSKAILSVLDEISEETGLSLLIPAQLLRKKNESDEQYCRLKEVRMLVGFRNGVSNKPNYPASKFHPDRLHAFAEWVREHLPPASHT